MCVLDTQMENKIIFHGNVNLVLYRRDDVMQRPKSIPMLWS